MSAEESHALVMRFFEQVWNQGALETIDELFADDYIAHSSVAPARGRAGIKDVVRYYRTAFPDTHFSIQDIIATAEKVVVRWTAAGTHSGPLHRIAPTGQRVTVNGISIYRLAGGQIVESWTSWDSLGELQQLGQESLPEQAQQAGS